MQLASRLCRLGAVTTRKSNGSNKVTSMTKVTKPSSSMRVTKMKFHSRSALLDSGKAVGHHDGPALPEKFDHLEIPSDLMAEANAFKDEVEKMEEEEAKMVMVDLVQTIATQVGLIQRAAVHLKKDVRDITALDVATYRLHEHEEFVSKVELDKVVLFSHETALANYRAGVKAIAARYPDNKLPAWLQTELDENDKLLSSRVAEQEIIELQVSEDVYQTAQKNLFPSFVKKGITPQEYLDFVGGSDGLIDPVTFHVRDLLIQLEQAPSAQKAELLTKLEQSIVQFEDSLPEEYTEDEKASLVAIGLNQNNAELSMAMKAGVGRGIKMGDLNPERRLERSLEINHPILSLDQTYYVHGDVSNIKEATAQIVKDEAPVVEFHPREDFNPPTVYRDLHHEGLQIEPETHTHVQNQMLNFPMWEGIESATAINSTELIVEMKLYKLFNYMYPMLGDSPSAQKLFLEMFDVSPGEPTLEWVLGYPTKEHTFFPEHPMWVHVFEDDEDVAPIVWPNYTPVAVEGTAEVSSAFGGDSATIKFLPHSKTAIASEAYLNFVLSRLPVEKRFSTPKDEVNKAIAALTAAEKSEAEKVWASLTAGQKALARDAAKFEASPVFTAAQFVKNQEALQKLEQRALSDKL